MKKNEVPQDDANMLEGKFREPCYVLDENGKYITVGSVGWEPKNIVMQQAWDNIHKRIARVKELVDQGRLSPLAYHMEKNQMDVRLLASYVGLSRWKVKRHLKPSGFLKLDTEILKKYADALNVTIEELRQTD
ncbi:MAG: helix-turn-helix transcriptional regulator [Bacteroidetes bacterium]|nr:helix-turn-helix transcriptional regulator [Bacteroidota bacterium]